MRPTLPTITFATEPPTVRLVDGDTAGELRRALLEVAARIERDAHAFPLGANSDRPEVRGLGASAFNIEMLRARAIRDAIAEVCP